jgi:phytoene dehydrogenase-like protein
VTSEAPPKNRASSYDAIVIGAGHNGLVCACYLAGSGLKVAVLERTDRIGGACITEELWPGFRMSTASYSVSLLQPEIIRELALDLDIRMKDPIGFTPYLGGGGLVLHRNRASRHEAISELSPHDADAYEELHDLFEEAARRLRPLLSYPATRRQARRAFRRSEFERLFARTVDGSIGELCEEYFESDPLKGFVASQGLIGTFAGPRTPGTAYVFLHHSLGQATGVDAAWGFVRGGMGAITQELARVARERGVDIRLESEVATLKVEGRRAAGVVLQNGEEIDAGVVCSNATPSRTVEIVGADMMTPEFVEDVELMPTEGTVVKVNCALSGLPTFKGMSPAGKIGPEHRGTIAIAPSIDYLEKACREAAEGRPSNRPFIECWIQTATEPELAPAEKHTLSIFAQWAPYHLEDSTWAERREAIGDLVLDALEEYAPGVSDMIEARMVLGPPDLEERFGLTGGNIFHGEILPDWILDKRPASGWHRHRLPVPGVYLCGSGAHPGGGVSGAPGRNAARAVIEDLVAAGPASPS